MGERTLVVATGHALSLALIAGQSLLANHHDAIGRGHAEALMPALTQMMAPFGGGAATNVSRIVVEVGPGSFTGLRIGHAAASALALAWGGTLVGVRSTLMLAAQHAACARGGQIAIAIAAPRGQYWVERFSMPSLASLAPPIALAPHDVSAWAGATALVGFPAASTPDMQPRAATVLSLDPGLFSSAVPLYVRRQDDIVIA